MRDKIDGGGVQRDSRATVACTATELIDDLLSRDGMLFGIETRIDEVDGNRISYVDGLSYKGIWKYTIQYHL